MRFEIKTGEKSAPGVPLVDCAACPRRTRRAGVATTTAGQRVEER
jgi:hypothetical protein